jgi:hypothetical protein
MTKHWTLWLARIALRKKGYWAIPLLLSAAFGILSALSVLAVIPSLNDRTLPALDAQPLRRADLAVDHALLALAELFEGGFVSCDNPSIVQMRKAIYRCGNLKDVRVFGASGSQLCSAYSEALDANETPDNSTPSLVAANRRISLSPVAKEACASRPITSPPPAKACPSSPLRIPNAASSLESSGNDRRTWVDRKAVITRVDLMADR